MLAPFAPYTAEELWETLGKRGPVFRQNWPTYDPELGKEDVIEIPLQVNGKLRGRLYAVPGTPPDELERLALAQEKTQMFTQGKQIRKVIVVPDRLVNIVAN
jgi:leucyl-tRNA synthetase